jgi:hypothetical protein
MRFLGIRGLVVSTAVAFACAPAVAHADLTWSTPDKAATLSPMGVDASNLQVATDDAGDAIAVWIESDSGHDRVAEAYRPAGGQFGSSTFISDPSLDASEPAVAMNGGGAAIVCWDQPTFGADTHEQVAFATRPAGGSFDTPRDASLGGGNASGGQVAIDAAGDDVVAYVRNDGINPSPRVQVSFRGINAADFDSLQTVSQPLNIGDPVPLADSPAIAMDAKGDAIVAFHSTYNPTSTPEQVVEVAYRPAGGLDPTGDPNSSSFYPKQTLSTEGDGLIGNNPSVAIDPAGDAIVAYQFFDGTNFTIQDAFRPAGTAVAGFVLPATTVSATSGVNLDPHVAIDGSGNAFADWQEESANPAVTQIEAAYRPASGPFGSPEMISGVGVNASAPEIGVDSQGRPAAIWTAIGSDGSDTLQAASRVAGSGPFSAPVSLSTSGDFGPAGSGDPDLSVSTGGQAVAVWQSQDGTELLAHATFGTPPGEAPPPPPPAPPPPAPTNIVADNSLQVDKPAVLSVKISGTFTRLQWKVGSGPTVTGVGTQDSIRFVPSTGTFSVSVTADGPGGSKTYSRKFTISKASTDQDSVLVRKALSGFPAVYGAGDATTLLGKNACGAVTVYSAKQQVSGCMRPINVLADIPDRERGSIQAMAHSLGLNPSDSGLMSAALQQVDGYVGVGPTNLDGKWPAVPSAGASMISFAGLGDLTSSNASLNVGGLNFGGVSGGFSLNVDPSKLNIPLGSLPKPSLPDIGGFPLVGNWNIDLGDSDATIDTHLQLPSWLNIGGIPLQIPITLHATPSGLVLDKLNIGPLDVDLGPLSVTKFHITYDRASDTWTGSGEVCLLTGVCLDMSPPNGEVKIVHGGLNFAGATLVFPEGSGIPLFPGVDLTKIGFGLGLDPTRIVGRAAISVLDLVELDGTLVVGFPTAGHPFILARDEVGSDFPAEDYGPPFTEPTIGASADVFVNLPLVGNVKLGSGYLLFEIPDYIAVGGAADFTIPGVFELGGSLSGAANFSDRTLNLNAEVHACLLLVGKVCANAVVDISKAPNDGGGAGGCVGVGPLHIGGGILWKGFKIVVWPFDGCKWSRFKVDVKPSLASAAAASRTIQVAKGKPNPAVKLYGDGAAPLVRVTGPGGQQLDSTDSGLDYTPDGHIRILRYQGTSEDFTVVGLENASPGTYTVTTLPGSVPFTEIDSATDPPAAKATGKVTADGPHRTLSYAIRNRPDQTVTFWDVDHSGASTKIGQISGGGKGEIHFNPAPGNHIRTIVAQFALAGLPAERVTVAHYKPPAPQLPTPHGLHLTRRKKQMLVTWRPVAGAARYDVVVTDRRTGYQRLITSKRGSVVVGHLPLTVGGAVTVRATAQYRQSLTTRARFKRLAAPKSAFAKLAHCKVHKRSIKCVGGPPIKIKHRKHHPHKRRKR